MRARRACLHWAHSGPLAGWTGERRNRRQPRAPLLTMESQPTEWEHADVAAAVADVLAPHFTITDDAQPFATVHSHRLPVPPVGNTYIVLGRITLEEAFEANGKIHIPDWLQDLHDQVHGLLELDDTRDQWKGVAGRLHAIVCVTRVPGGRVRLQIRDCTRGTPVGTVHSLALGGKTRVKGADGKLTTVSDDAWTEIQHGDKLLLCPRHNEDDYTVFNFDVSIPLPPPTAEEAMVARLAQPHMVKFVLPGRDVGKLIGTGARIKTGLQTEHSCVIEIASKQHVYPGSASALIHGQAVALSASSAADIAPALRAVLTATSIPLEGFYLVVPVTVAGKLQGDDNNGLRRLQERLGVRLNMQPADATAPEQILEASGRIDGILAVVAHILTALGPKSACNYTPIEPIHARASVRGAGSGGAGARSGGGGALAVRNSVHGGGGGHASGMQRAHRGGGVRGRGGSSSAGGGSSGGRTPPRTGTATVCHFWLEGTCTRASCRYAHTEETQYQQGGGQSSKKDRDKAAQRGDNKTRNKVKKEIQKAGRKKRKSLRGNQGKGRQLDPKGKPGNKSKKAKASKKS